MAITSVDVGNVLARIRNSRTYNAVGFSCFEGYCKVLWGFTRTRLTKERVIMKGKLLK